VSFEILVEIVAIAVSFGVGAPILASSWSRRDRPALLLGSALVLDGAEWTCWALYLHTGAEGTPLGDALAVACRIGITASAACLLLFTREVFRPRSRWGGVCAGLAALGMGAAFVGSGLRGDWGGFGDDGWIWLENAAQLFAYAWVLVEATRHWRKLRRRLRIGLADPVMTHRILLWGLYGGSLAISQLLWMLVIAAFQDPSALDAPMLLVAIGGEVALWLAFFPPEPYLRRIRARAVQPA
jgi:hypothetical protein